MSEAESPGTRDSVIAAVLERHLDQIVDRYTERLAETGSALLDGDGVQQQVVKHAYALLDLVAAEMTGRAMNIHSPGLSREIGATRATGRVHPKESMHAANLLFASVSEIVQHALPPEALKPDALSAFYVILHRKVTDLYGAATISYIEHLLDQIQTAQQDEHRRIARELHDRVAGEAGTAANDLELYEIYRDRDHDSARRALTSAKSAVQRTLKTIREVSAELRLQASTIPLRPALQNYLDTHRPEAMATHLVFSGNEHLLPPRVKYELYLLIREAIRNALVHSRATRLDVRIVIEPSAVHGVVGDDGVGFDVDSIPAGHAGVVSMRERAELVGGTLTVDTRPGAGTTVRVRVPLTGEHYGNDE